MLKPIFSHNFNSIVEMCIAIIAKSDMEKNEKLALFAKINSIAWDYSESIDDGTDLPLEYYFDQLIEVLKPTSRQE